MLQIKGLIHNLTREIKSDVRLVDALFFPTLNRFENLQSKDFKPFSFSGFPHTCYKL